MTSNAGTEFEEPILTQAACPVASWFSSKLAIGARQLAPGGEKPGSVVLIMAGSLQLAADSSRSDESPGSVVLGSAGSRQLSNR
jgi:hypothetical protein